jgi:hypothetical protein
MLIWAIHVEVPNVFLKNILAELNQLVFGQVSGIVTGQPRTPKRDI